MNKATHKLVTKGQEFHVYLNGQARWIYERDGLGRSFELEEIQSLTPIPKEPETFDWKEAMRKFADGVEIEALIRHEWRTFGDIGFHAEFFSTQKYRVKPTSPPEPKVTEYWVNWYGDHIGMSCLSLEDCKRKWSDQNVTARLKITVTEGELPKVEVIPVN